ncbi:CheR family methyltransferase [Psychromonas sp. Urea-02u-13]|uniref:CheR family methyltransferase n=1 Tax=Psychromonas sp. Urea-02u-13 TaxID=2058326 RepID=UPI000C330731|nr:CheR family methyltransferase [Psychromonas sp. Urea-02u-13]PKG38377.1 chemotaxis protein CheR [Psychromonas sp. Urea-02u-13]
MSSDREFVFTANDFAHVQKLIYEHAGISLSEQKNDLVYSRLAKRLRKHKIHRFDTYLQLLDNTDHPEWEEFINALTTNLTSFFRENHHFTRLSRHLKDNYARASTDKPIKIWCAASSTGEEPYSIAMTVASAFGKLNPPVKILATDLDTQVLAKAEKGIYQFDTIDKLSSLQKEHFFLKGNGAQAGQVMIRPELKSLITFNQLNLLSNWPMKGKFDFIFCRNVMIYFDKATQYKLLEDFSKHLNKGGLLFVGHSESFPEASRIFKLDKQTVYVRC